MIHSKQHWIEDQGPQVLSKLGILSNQTVLDFGCGTGNYTLPAAIQVGQKGRIYALDDTLSNLKTLKKHANNLHLSNIEYVTTQGKIEIPKVIPLVNTILAFDILHFFNEQQRKKLYQDFHTHLKNKGTLIIYPKHTKDNWPMWNLSSTSTNDLIQEIKQKKFSLKETKTIQLIHDNQPETGTVLIFSKK